MTTDNLSSLEQEFLTRLIQLAPEIGEPIHNWRFHPRRRWMIDFAWPAHKVGVELMGGSWNNGAHVRGKGYTNDCQKANAAMLDGWIILRYTSDMVSGDPVSMVYEVKTALERAELRSQVEKDMLRELIALRREFNNIQGEL